MVYLGSGTVTQQRHPDIGMSEQRSEVKLKAAVMGSLMSDLKRHLSSLPKPNEIETVDWLQTEEAASDASSGMVSDEEGHMLPQPGPIDASDFLKELSLAISNHGSCGSM
jgi:hypothetical protein